MGAAAIAAGAQLSLRACSRAAGRLASCLLSTARHLHRLHCTGEVDPIAAFARCRPQVNESAKRNLENELAGYRLEAQRQAKLIAQLEKEREKYSQEANEAGGRYVEVGGNRRRRLSATLAAPACS